MNIIMKNNFLLILANLLVPDDFDETQLTTITDASDTPVHQFA